MGQVFSFSLAVLLAICPVTTPFAAAFDPGDAPSLGLATAAARSPQPGVTTAQDPVTGQHDAPLVNVKIRELMQESKFAEAIGAIEAAMRDPQGPNDYLGYLRGRAFYLNRQYEQAVGAFQQVRQQFPQGPWFRRAQFGEALAHARLGDFQKAEAIYRQQAEHLLSADRKQQIAEIYLEFADEYFDPPQKPDSKPDYEKALTFYSKAMDVGPKPPEQQRIARQIARCHQELGRHDEAAKLYGEFIQNYDDSPLDVEVRFRLGEVQLAQGQHQQARRTWQDLLAKHPDSSSDRMAQAMFLLSRTWRIPEPQDEKQLSLGVTALEAFWKRFPDHPLAAEAHLDAARSYIHRGQYEEAVASLRLLLTNDRYRQRAEIAEARHLLGRCYQLQKKFSQALDTWREYLSKHPAHKAWSSVQMEIINTEFYMAVEARSEKDYDRARELFAQFVAKYPLDERNPQILFGYGEMNYSQKNWEPAIDDWRRLVSKYPASDFASRGQFMIASTLEQKMARLSEALDEYKKLDWGPMQKAARQAIARLTAKSVSVVTERIFRSDETPSLNLTTRNVEKVTVRAYKVDMETYFRKMHLAHGVELLDIALIDPDASFEFAIPDYAEYQQLESAVEVPLPGNATAGVMAVTISTETLEATTMVIQSDLDIIVKSSRDEVFVFAENMLTGEPWPQAKLLISNGDQVFAEATTKDDGVFQQSYKELRETDDVRVFALQDGHVASNVVGLKGVGVAQGLSDKGYLYTDRPAYRAGDLVHVRGCLRQVADDRYVVPTGKKYKLQAFDPRNRLLREENVVLGDFGTFHAHFMLPRTCPQGDYRFVVIDEQDHQYQGSFVVHEYKLEPIRLIVDTPRHVYYRGETIEGTIRAEFYHGAPLAGRQITYQLAGDRSFTAATNEKGEVTFQLPTRDFLESQVLPLVVTLPERAIQSTVNFFLSTQGFSLELETVRPVYVADESFEISLHAKDAEGKPIGQKLTLRILERTRVNGKVGERLVEEHELTTDEKGVARQTVSLDSGGEYVCRAVGTDRFENVVSGEVVVKISDDKDSVRLRILADRHTLKVGDTAQVQIHWREQPALALVTFQGARVLDYRLVTLNPGANLLQIPMTVELAPNFDLAIAVMTNARSAEEDPVDSKPVQRFHTASSSFTVARQLQVQIDWTPTAADRPSVKPGEEVKVTVKTTDPQGKPVPAEVSLAMLEKSLLDRFSWSMPAIDDFFEGNPRQPMVRTTSSITFAYKPSTRPIDPQLLAEWRRLEVEREEEVSRTEALVAGEPFAMDQEDAVISGLVPATEVPTEVLDESLDVWVHAGRAPTPDRALYGRPAGGVTLQSAPAPDQPVTHEQLFDNFIREGGQPQDYALQLGSFSLDAEGRRARGETAIQRYYAPANVDNLVQLGKQNRQNVLVLNANGVLQGVNLWGADQFDPAQALELANKLADSGAVLLPDVGPQDTAYWNPVIVTDQDGQATVTFSVPERSTAWTFAAKGITVDTLAGEITRDLTVKKDLFGELKLPLAFTDGDRAEVLATVHNGVVQTGRITVSLKTTIAGRSVTETKTIDVGSQGLHEVSFVCELNRPKDEEVQSVMPPQVEVEFELAVTAEAEGNAGAPWTDVVRQNVPLQPYGMPVFATTSGLATSDTTVWVEAPQEMSLTSPSLEILVGPTVEQSLVDIVLAPAPRCQLEMNRIASSLESTTSDLMASVGLQELLAKSRQSGGPTLQAIDSRIRAAVSVLVASQNDDGGWSWTGQDGNSDRYASARALWSLVLARKAAYRVADDNFDKAVSFLKSQVAATDSDDYESKAILLHALTVAGDEDFTLANRLYRSRPVLSPAALLYTALIFAEMDRTSTAKELLDTVAEKNLSQVTGRRSAVSGLLPWCSSPTELRALYALALEETEPASQRIRETVDWLMAHRTGHRWTPDKATGPAALALCRWSAQSRFEGEKYRLTVSVNGQQAGVLKIDPSSLTQTIPVPHKLLQEGKQRVSFQLTGRGRYTYQCILAGFVPAEKLKNTTKLWEVRRYHQPAPLERDGKVIPRGFDVLTGSYSSFRNTLTQLPTAKRGQVELRVWRQGIPANTPDSQLEYLVITEPVPCGTTVVADSVRGGFERFEITSGEITFYVGSRHQIGTIQYDLIGYLPGEYRAGPTVVRNAYRPDELVVTQPKSLAVLPLGTKSSDEYRLTPRELFELGKLEFAAGQLDAAQTHLEELVEKWNLRPKTYKEAVTTLFNLHLAKGPSEKIVRYFEIVREKWPSENIPFEKILKVGTAYDEMGEYERSYLVFRATVQSSFSRESSVAGFLESQGEFLRSVDCMGQLLQEYPPESYIAAADYSLAQRIYAKAPEAADDAKLRDQKVNRVDLTKRAWRLLETFLTAHPDDPAADQAAFAAANTLLDLEAYVQAAAACQHYAQRYPKSDLLDGFWYIIGYCRFAMGEHQQALEMCRKVAEATRIDERTGREKESDDKWRAIYILGQIHHSQGEAASAIAEYRRVEDRFPDAKQSIEYFTRKDIQLPEVTTVEPDKQVEVKLEYRNIANCDIKVYRIDLMKFGLLKRDLQGITQINLAGIRPFFEQSIELGDGKDYGDRSRQLDLPLEKEGAYLVVCRGENLYSSGLLLVTPLAVEVQEDAVAGRVRTTVKDRTDDRYLHDVHVKVIGSRNNEFVSGQSDLRGVFVADGILGRSTVIAQASPSHYAFFRGEANLVPEAARDQDQSGQTPAQKPAESLKRQLLEGLQLRNSLIQQKQVQQLDELYEAPAEGVEASKALE